MAKIEKKGPSWNEVERKIKGINEDELLELIEDLYGSSDANRDFFHIRFSLVEDPVKSYKRIIQDSVHPYLEDGETLNIERAIDAIHLYSSAVEDDVHGEIELMIFFVECGNNFTLSYGGIDDEFYDSLILIYEMASKKVLELSTEEQKIFEARLRKIMVSASGIGWGYHNGLREWFHKSFPDDR